MRTHPLADRLAAEAATVRLEDGVAVPASFGDAAVEYAALARGAGLVDLGFRTVVVATGTDRVEFLHGMLTNDVAGLGEGGACPALLLTVQGRVTADVDVLRHDEAFWLVVDRAAVEGVEAALRRLLIADDVELARDEHLAVIAVVGPRGPAVFAGLARPAPWHHTAVAVDGVPVRVLAGAPFDPDDTLVFVRATEASRLWDALAARGATPCGRDAFDARRIALGVPRVGVDMGESTLAIELPLERRISDRKGCYLGQEVVARGTSRGKVNRRLCGLVFTGGMAHAGESLVADGRTVGVVTSVAGPPAVETPIGLGVVRRAYWDAGTALHVGAAGSGVVARVGDWPLA